MQSIQEILWLICFTTICLLTACLSLEELEREIFLQPRNFNPHPYQVSAGYVNKIEANGNRGPVLFPTTPTDLDGPNGNPENINAGRDNNNLFIDTHPYVAVVRKQNHKQAGRFHNQDEINANVNPKAFQALTATAAKLLKKPLTDINNPTYSLNKKAYAFSYKVRDQFSGDDFSHSQKQDSKSTNGEYRVKLPDGRIQIVSYIADKNGYKADVKYAENENSNPKAYSPEQQIRPIQIVQNEIKRKPAQYPDYVYEDYVPDLNVQKYPIYKDNYVTPSLPIYRLNDDELEYTVNPVIAVTSKYENQLQINPYIILNNDVQTISQQKVFENIHNSPKVIQIDEHNFNNGKVGKFIDSTLAPYTIENSKGFQKTILSTLSPQLEKYTELQVNSHNFRFSPKQRHQFLYKK